MKCSICFKEIQKKPGWAKRNNAQPVNNGRCCDTCNNTVVLRARVNILYRKEVKNDSRVK